LTPPDCIRRLESPLLTWCEGDAIVRLLTTLAELLGESRWPNYPPSWQKSFTTDWARRPDMT
jgi:hypothetical protein